MEKKILVWNGIWNGKFLVWNEYGIWSNMEYEKIAFHSIACPGIKKLQFFMNLNAMNNFC